MTQMSSFQMRRCLEALDKIMSHRISLIFSEPVDPILDNCKDYFEVIDTPMDLGTVRETLLSGGYPDVMHFIAAVNTIWENAYKYNGKASIIGNIAKELQMEFEGATAFITGNDLVDWVNEAEWLKAKLGIPSIGSDLSKALSGEDVKQAPPPKEEKHPPFRKVYKNEQGKLAEDIQSLDSEDERTQIVDLIASREPEFVQCNQVDLDLCDLNDFTLFKLKKLVSKLKMDRKKKSTH